MSNLLNPALADATHVQLIKDGEEFKALVFSRHAADGSEIGTPTTVTPHERLRPYPLDGWINDVFSAMRAFPAGTDPNNGRRRLECGLPHEIDPVGTEALVTIYFSRPMLAVSARDAEGFLRTIGWSSRGDRDKIDLLGLRTESSPDTVVAYVEWLLETVFHPFAIKARHTERDPYVLTVA